MTRILRLVQTLDKTGDTKSPHYAKTAAGLFTKPVKIGGRRASGWPEHEVEAIVAARIAGADEEAIRKLVAKLHEDRSLSPAVAAGSAH